MKYTYLFITLILSFSLSCSSGGGSNNRNSQTTTEFTVLSNGTTLEMNGDITSSSLSNFNELYEKFPNINLLSIKECEGSSDDATNHLLMKRIYDSNINTHLQTNGFIASGGVDLFLSGRRRTMGTNTKIGVHAWADNDGNSAQQYPKDHAVHMPYINSYTSIGFSDTDARNFYEFTIDAAAADKLHFMTNAEIAQYKSLTE